MSEVLCSDLHFGCITLEKNTYFVTDPCKTMDCNMRQQLCEQL